MVYLLWFTRLFITVSQSVIRFGYPWAIGVVNDSTVIFTKTNWTGLADTYKYFFFDIL